jgi:hypothetical protein
MRWFASELDLKLVTCNKLEACKTLVVAGLVEDLVCSKWVRLKLVRITSLRYVLDYLLSP